MPVNKLDFEFHETQGIYREKLILNSDDNITMQAFPDVAIALNAMFPMHKIN